jgi:charged multivesicular body protein 7
MVLKFVVQTIKFVDGAGSSTITVVDRGILELKTAVHNLRAQVDALHFKIDE